MTVSIREYARQRGVSDAAVRKWIKAGKITLVGGKVDPVIADECVAANRLGSQASRIADAAVAPPVNTPVGTPASTGVAEPETSKQGTLASAQRELVQAKAAKADIELQKLRGEMIAVADVEATVGELITTAKSRLMLVPDKICDSLVPMTDPIAIRNVLEHELRLALDELARFEVAA